MDLEHPLQRLEGRTIGPFRLHLTRLEATSKSGWKRFELRLIDGVPCDPPVVAGLHSMGGRGVAPWIEVMSYRPEVICGDNAVSLATDHLDVTLFRALADLIPPGGHIMVWCEGPAHKPTYLGLARGVPPAATPLGALLLQAGFPKIKFFDLAEGGWEGEQKLWAEKPLDRSTDLGWQTETVQALKDFLARADAAAAVYRQLAEEGLAQLRAASPEQAPA